MTVAAGTTLGGYRVERLLGRGGMGEVYLAEQRSLHRKVALKLLNPALAEAASFRERFIREAELAASIDHPNIVPIYEAGEAEGRLFLAMRFVDGPSLEAVLRSEGRLSLERTVRILRGIASGLDTAHAAGLCHRDVKPANILLARRSEHPYLADFGLTRLTGSGDGLTAPDQLVGSVDYVAPEQIEGQATDSRTDVYALGAVLFTCLAGEPPFVRDSELATLWAHLHADRPSFAAARPELGGLDPVIARAMAVDPALRPASATRMIDEVAARGGTPDIALPAASDKAATVAIARPESRSDSASTEPPGGSGMVPTRMSRTRSLTRRPLLVAATLTGLALLLVIAARWALPTSTPLRPGSSASLATSSRPPASWSLEPIDPTFAGARIHGLGYSFEGYLAVGETGAESSPAIWYTHDSSGASGSWRRAADSPLFAGATLADTVSSPFSPNVIVGSVCATGPSSCAVAAWWTDDSAGATWTRAVFRGDPREPAHLTGAGPGGLGLVAVGSTDGPSPVGVLWTTADGKAWTRVLAKGSPLGAGVRDVTDGGPGLVAVGSDGENGIVWTSADGSSWSVAPTGSAFAGVALASVAEVPGGLLAVGNGPRGVEVWSSTDGTNWAEDSGLPHLAYVFGRGINVNLPFVVLLGDGPDGVVILRGSVPP